MPQAAEIPTTSRASAHPIAPYSRPAALAKLDQRTREARLMRDARAELIAHVGGRPSATQRALIEQAVQLRLRLAVMDRTFAESVTMTEHDLRTYLAWSNSYTRTLRQLGLEAAPSIAAGPTLAEILAAGPPARARTAPASAPGAVVPATPQGASGAPARAAETA